VSAPAASATTYTFKDMRGAPPPSSPQLLIDWLSQVILHSQSGSSEDQDALYRLALALPTSRNPFSDTVLKVIALIKDVAKQRLFNPELHTLAKQAREELKQQKGSPVASYGENPNSARVLFTPTSSSSLPSL